MTFDLDAVRARFPALHLPYIFLDNPGGTQVADTCLQRIRQYLIESNANHGGSFATSRASDALVEEAHAAMADFLNAGRPEEIVFGANMTTLTFAMSRAIGRTLQPDDTLVVTQLDHDANISPWMQLAEDRGCKLRWVPFHAETCTLDMDALRAALEEKPRLVAVGYASNAVGTINPIAEIVDLAHQAGALVYVDAVQYAPHGPIDVRKLGCDFLVCSAYKFFGPHIGALYGRYELLENLRAYKVRPAPANPPGKFETGTGCFENMAGLLGALEHLAWVGETHGADFEEALAGAYTGRRLTFKKAMHAIQRYELELSGALLATLQAQPGVHLYGLTSHAGLAQRVPTFSFTRPDASPQQLAAYLGRKNINVWDGNFYALAVTQRLGLEDRGGLLRVGAAHYNTLEEVQRLGEALANYR